MDTDDRIDAAVAAGEKNKAATELIRNWCRHARVEKHGGVGFIEAQTGLPIGHHAMACDHAVAHGMAMWDLAEAALDFHDRNCVNCTHRLPAAFPNLSILLGEREARRKKAEAERQAARDQIVGARARRQQIRQALRAELPAPSAGVVDCLEDLDQDGPNDAVERLLATAKLAPEAFSSALIEHFFTLLEADESWFVEAGLQVLRTLNVDPARLSRCALRSLSQHRAIVVAAAIVEAHPELTDSALVAAALPALIDLANPEYSPFSYERTLLPAPLCAIHRKHPGAVEAAIEELISSRNPRVVSLGAGAIETLASQDGTIAPRFTRTLAAKLAGAKWLIDRRRTGILGEDECIIRLQKTLVLALQAAPAATDDLIAHFLAGAADKGEARLYEVYRRALRERDRQPGDVQGSDPAARAALKRLIAGLAGQRNEEVLTATRDALAHCADNHTGLAQKELTALLGAALLIDEDLKRFDAQPAAPKDLLSHLERQNQRHLRTQLQGLLLEWATEGAKGSAVHTRQYVDVFSGIPEERDELRSALIENAHPLLRTPEGLNLMLPSLYTALVGTSTRARAAATRAIGELHRRGREDLPTLVYEAFTALLSDPYVLVHTTAVEALEKLDLPPDLDRMARSALARLIEVYNVSKDKDRFLVQCIRLYLDRYAAENSKRGRLGKLFLAMLERMEPDIVLDELRTLRHDLAELDGFAALVVRLLSHAFRSEHRAEEALRALNDLPTTAIQQHKTKIAEIAVAESTDRLFAAHLVETLTRAGAWEEAAQVNETIYVRIPETTERRPLKLHVNLDRIATRFEESLSRGGLEDVPALATDWRNTVAQIEEDRRKHAQQRSPFPGFPSAD